MDTSPLDRLNQEQMDRILNLSRICIRRAQEQLGPTATDQEVEDLAVEFLDEMDK